MSTVRSTLASKVYHYVGDVPDCPIADGGIPLQLVLQLLVETEDQMLRDLDLSDQNRRVSSFQVSSFSSDGSFTVPMADFEAPAYAFLRLDQTSQLWYPVEITNHGSITQATLDGRLAVGFYGTPQRGQMSWIPEGGQVLQVWYDRSGDSNPLLSGETDISSLYDSHLAMLAGAQAREFMGLPVGSVLASRLAKGEKQWERFVTTSRQQGTVQKRPGFTPRRYRRYPALDRSRFLLP